MDKYIMIIEGLTPRVYWIMFYVFMALITFVKYGISHPLDKTDKDIDIAKEEFYIQLNGIIYGSFWPVVLIRYILKKVRCINVKR